MISNIRLDEDFFFKTISSISVHFRQVFDIFEYYIYPKMIYIMQSSILSFVSINLFGILLNEDKIQQKLIYWTTFMKLRILVLCKSKILFLCF